MRLARPIYSGTLSSTYELTDYEFLEKLESVLNKNLLNSTPKDEDPKEMIDNKVAIPHSLREDVVESFQFARPEI